MLSHLAAKEVSMRLGAPIIAATHTADAWADAVRAAGYTAAYCPLDDTADEATIADYARAAAERDIVIAEVGAWGNNPISPDPSIAQASIAACAARLRLADAIGARCCVNVSGSRGARWDGPHRDNLTPATLDLVVCSVQVIIDQAAPQRAVYCLEMMPWMAPDSAECYLELLARVDRPQFAVHVDPVNLLCSPWAYDHNGELIQDIFRRLGPRVRSCHAKDARLRETLTFHVDEVLPGEGALDYDTYLTELARLDPDTPLMVEHLRTPDEYTRAVAFIRGRCEALGISLH
jgi:sugar phosphate isomerase/epimerase